MYQPVNLIVLLKIFFYYIAIFLKISLEFEIFIAIDVEHLKMFLIRLPL